MESRGPVQDWRTRRRYVIALAVGVGWSLLWFGLDRVAFPPYVFWIASAILFGPVLAFLARDWLDVAGLALAAYVLSLALTEAVFAPRLPDLARDLGLATAAWVPTWLTAAGIFAWRARTGAARAE